MLQSPTWRIAWKEYRTQRSLWLAIAVLTVLVQLGYQIAVTVGGYTVVDQVLFGIATVAAAVYALGCGATLFAAERETETFEFQRSLPLAWRPLLVGKAGFGAASVLALAIVLWMVTLALAGGRLPAWQDSGQLWGGGLLAAAEVFAWGLLFSLLLDRPLVAAVLGVLVPSVVVHVAAPAVVGFDYESVGFRHYLALIPLRTALVVAVGAADLCLTRRWLGEGGAPWDFGTDASEDAAAAEGEEASPASEPLLPSRFWCLVWQQWRQARWTIAAIGLGYLAAILLTLRADRPSVWNELPLGWLVPAAALWGVAVFAADQRRQAYRYFAERGVSPRRVWLSRQLVGAAPLVIGLAAAVVFWALFPQVERGRLRGPPAHDDAWFAGGAICCALLAYAAGQACSLFFRSAILALVATVFSGLTLVCWLVLMRAAEISWSWSVLPIPVVLLMATWRRAPDWILERTSWAARWRLGATLAVPAAVLVTAVILVRIYEIPWVEPGFDVDEFLAPPTAEQTETLRLYERAAASLQPMKISAASATSSGRERSDNVPTPAEPTLEDQRRWVAENEATIALLLAASRRPPCPLWDPARGQWRLPDRIEVFRDLLLADATALVASGQLDAAWERYVAALRVANAGRLQGESSLYLRIERIERQVYEQLPRWAGHPQQTPQRIKAALRELEKLSRDVPSATSIIQDASVEAVRPLEGDFRRMEGADPQAVRMMRLAYALLPWEAARARRLTSYFTARHLARIQALEQALCSGGPATRVPFVLTSPSNPHEHRERDLVQLNAWARTTPLAGRNYWSLNAPFSLDDRLWEQETYRRVVRVQMALLAWRHEHGQFPEQLEVLVGPYFDQLPLDPCCGHPFGYQPHGWPRETRWLRANLMSPQFPSGALDPLDPIVLPAGRPCLWSPGSGQGPAASPPAEPPIVSMPGNVTAYSGYLFLLDPPP